MKAFDTGIKHAHEDPVRMNQRIGPRKHVEDHDRVGLKPFVFVGSREGHPGLLFIYKPVCPGPEAVVEISRLFGFRCPWPEGETAVELEDVHPLYGAGTDKKAVNVIQQLDPLAAR